MSYLVKFSNFVLVFPESDQIQRPLEERKWEHSSRNIVNMIISMKTEVLMNCSIIMVIPCLRNLDRNYQIYIFKSLLINSFNTYEECSISIKTEAIFFKTEINNEGNVIVHQNSLIVFRYKCSCEFFISQSTSSCKLVNSTVVFLNESHIPKSWSWDFPFRLIDWLIDFF